MQADHNRTNICILVSPKHDHPKRHDGLETGRQSQSPKDATIIDGAIGTIAMLHIFELLLIDRLIISYLVQSYCHCVHGFFVHIAEVSEEDQQRQVQIVELIWPVFAVCNSVGQAE